MRHLEDFRPGERFVTPEIEVTLEEVVAFAERYDPQPFHTDPEAATRSVFGRLVASGWHTAALTMRLWALHGPDVAGGLVGLGVDEVRWRALEPGDRIPVEAEVLEVRRSGSGAPRGTVRLRVLTRNHRDEDVQSMVATMLVPTRASG